MKSIAGACLAAALVGTILGYIGAYVDNRNVNTYGYETRQWRNVGVTLLALPGIAIGSRGHAIEEAWTVSRHRIAIANGLFYAPLGLLALLRKGHKRPGPPMPHPHNALDGQSPQPSVTFNRHAFLGGCLQVFCVDVADACFGGAFYPLTMSRVVSTILQSFGFLLGTLLLILMVSLLVVGVRFLFLGKQTRKDLRSAFAWILFSVSLLYTAVVVLMGITIDSPAAEPVPRWLGFIICIPPLLAQPWPPDYHPKWER